MTREVVGLAFVWGGAALTLALGLHALVRSEADGRVRLLGLVGFGLALVTSFFLGPAPRESLTVPISVAFFSVMLLLFVTVIDGTHLRKRP